MDMERNLFDLVQNLEPEDELAEDKSETVVIERIKFRVFQKKGVKRMKHRGLRRFAAAAAAVLVLGGGVVTVDAATDGKITKGIKEITLTIISLDGSSEMIIEPAYIKKEDGTYEIDLGDDSSLGIKPGDVPLEDGDINSSEEGDHSVKIEKKESADGKSGEVSVNVDDDKTKMEFSKQEDVEYSGEEE